MDTNQTSTKSGLDLNGSPLFSYPDDAITAVIKSDNLGSICYGNLRSCCRGSGHSDGLSVIIIVVLNMFCWKRDVAAMLLFFSVWFYKTPSTFLFRWFLIRRRTMFGFFETKKATKPPWCFSHWYVESGNKKRVSLRRMGRKESEMRGWGDLFGVSEEEKRGKSVLFWSVKANQLY